MRILVGRASWQGSTAEITRRVAAVLERAGATVEVVPSAIEAWAGQIAQELTQRPVAEGA